MHAEVIQVIDTGELRGATADDRGRFVRQFWSLGGELLAEHDPAPPLPKPVQAAIDEVLEEWETWTQYLDEAGYNVGGQQPFIDAIRRLREAAS